MYQINLIYTRHTKYTTCISSLSSSRRANKIGKEEMAGKGKTNWMEMKQGKEISGHGNKTILYTHYKNKCQTSPPNQDHLRYQSALICSFLFLSFQSFFLKIISKNKLKLLIGHYLREVISLPQFIGYYLRKRT